MKKDFFQCVSVLKTFNVNGKIEKEIISQDIMKTADGEVGYKLSFEYFFLRSMKRFQLTVTEEKSIEFDCSEK